MAAFTPSRLTVARRRRGLKKNDLAAMAAITRRSVSAFESGDAVPGADTLVLLAKALNFPLEFFSSPPLEEIRPTGASFRSLSTMTSSQRDSVLAAGSIAIEVNSKFEREFSLPAPNLPDLRGSSPEAAADELRAHWGIGELAIGNAIHLLESHGVRVFSLAEECKEVDGFSFWRNGTPFVFLNTFKSGERGRFDAAHELGHLMLHRHGGPLGRTAEREADQFGSAFLMPRSTVIAVAPRMPTMQGLIQLKHRWGVSVGALCRRLFDLGMMSEWQYRQSCIEIARNGWRTLEPEGLPRETSQMFRKIFASLREEGVSHSGIAKELMISPSELDALVFRMVLYVIDGGAPKGKPTIVADRPQLQLFQTTSIVDNDV